MPAFIAATTNAINEALFLIFLSIKNALIMVSILIFLITYTFSTFVEYFLNSLTI